MFRLRSIALLLALATLLVYLPATSYNFINFDDPSYIVENPVVQKGLTWAGVKWAFSGMHVCNWHPLTWLSHMVDCNLFRMNPAGPHLVNILFHAANAALLFTLLFRVTEKLWPAAFVAALFAWHPLHVESVVWISERKDVLSTFFTLLSILSYANYVKNVTGGAVCGRQSLFPVIRPPARFFWQAVLYFGLALLAKPMPVTLPVVLLFLDYWPLGRWNGEMWLGKSGLRLVWEKWPFFLLTAVSCVVTLMAQQQTVRPLAIMPFFFRLENVLTAYAGYLGKMVWPLDLAVFYPLRVPIAWPSVAAAAIVLTGISVIVWRERKNSPWLIVGWLWFLVSLVPVIGLVQVGSQAMADRYSYFPLIGIFLGITYATHTVACRYDFFPSWLAATAVLILAACVVLTEKQLRYWRDSETLFTHTLAVDDSEMARLCLGSTFLDQNRTSEALSQFIIAWRINPDSYGAYGNIARVFDQEGKLEMAAVYYQKSVQQNPQSALVYKNLGCVLVKLKRYDEALKQFSAASQLEVTDGQTDFIMGRLLLQLGRDAEALPHFRQALQLDPENLEILIYTITVLAADENQAVRNGAEARMLASKAITFTGGQQPAVLDVLAMSYAENGQFDEAVQILQQAIKQMEATGSKDDVALMQKRLQLYQTHQPWRESFKIVANEHVSGSRFEN